MQKLVATNIEETTFASLKLRVKALHRDVSKHLRALIEEDLENTAIADMLDKAADHEEEPRSIKDATRKG